MLPQNIQLLSQRLFTRLQQKLLIIFGNLFKYQLLEKGSLP